LGQLGELRQEQGQLDQAQANTKKALAIAQSIGATDIAYQWQWQLGQILQEQGNAEAAITAYETAVNNLESIRSDLVTVNRDVQFSFRDSVEPVYRELVGLLLKEDAQPQNLEKARKVIESLQQAELVNFFRENCLTAQPVEIDQIDQKAAVIYPIVLPDRLEIVVTLPNSNNALRHYSNTGVNTESVEALLDDLRMQTLFSRGEIKLPDPQEIEDLLNELGVETSRSGQVADVMQRPGTEPFDQQRYLDDARAMYDLLVRPAEGDLQASGVETLVFVLDGPLLNLPMAVLHDGEQYLIEKYAIAQTPGLQLLDPEPLERGELTVLKGGLSEARGDFGSLPNVEKELNAINERIPGAMMFNEEFTEENVQQAIDSSPFPVVHLATHGKFSSNPEETFLLTWDGRLSIEQLNQLLQGREESTQNAIELLVLSACETATGDRRAALGLAGVAVRAGARSTLATLWQVDDEGTAEFMVEFYKQLQENRQISKAKALQQAQRSFLNGEEFQQPYYWAPFILVGNWL
jgi:CHAT domain-containing protein